MGHVIVCTHILNFTNKNYLHLYGLTQSNHIWPSNMWEWAFYGSAMPDHNGAELQHPQILGDPVPMPNAHIVLPRPTKFSKVMHVARFPTTKYVRFLYVSPSMPRSTQLDP